MAERFQAFIEKGTLFSFVCGYLLYWARNIEGDMEMRIEPGRFLVAPASILLATVTNTKVHYHYQSVGYHTKTQL